MINLFDKWRLPYPVFAIALGTLASRSGTAMVLPYVALLLTQLKHLPLYWAGIAIGGSYLAQALLVSFSASFFSNIHPFKLIKLSLCLYAAVFLLMGVVSELFSNSILVAISFIIGFLLVGCTRALIETTGQMIISELTPVAKKHYAFSLRYTFINIGTSCGPPIAIMLGILNTNFAFVGAACCVFIYFLLLQFTISNTDLIGKKSQQGGLLAAIKLLNIDKRLRYFILATIFCYIGFGQMEAMFAFVSYHFTHQTHVFAIMYAINGIVIILLQMPLVSYIKRFDIHRVIFVGILLLTSGLIGVAIAGIHVTVYYFSMILFTLGEIFSFSLIGLYIDQVADPSQRYNYFGLSNLALIGKISGPPLATWLCHFFGLRDGLLIIAIITMLAVPYILLAKRETINYALGTVKE